MKRQFIFYPLLFTAFIACSCERHISLGNKYQTIPCNRVKPRDCLYQEYYDSTPVPSSQGNYYHSDS